MIQYEVDKNVVKFKKEVWPDAIPPTALKCNPKRTLSQLSPGSCRIQAKYWIMGVLLSWISNDDGPKWLNKAYFELYISQYLKWLF